MSRRYRLSLPLWCPAGGVSCTGTCSPCRCGALWGACLLCRPPALPPRCLVGWRGCFGRLPTPPLVYFPAPLPRRGRISPLPPFPSGEGGDILFSDARGSAPCIPGIRPPAALTEPAKQVPSGGRAPGVAGSAGVGGTQRGARWFWSPANPAAVVPEGGGLPSLLPAYPAFSFLSCPLSPRPPSPVGKGETKSLFRRGLRPRHPCIRPFAALTEPAKQVPSGGLSLGVGGTRRGHCG